MTHKYGTFTQNQMAITKKEIRKQIFFLLLCIDPETKHNYTHINVDDAFKSLLYKLDGLSGILQNPPELVDVVSLLEEACIQYNRSSSNFNICRRLILKAGSLVGKIKEVD